MPGLVVASVITQRVGQVVCSSEVELASQLETNVVA